MISQIDSLDERRLLLSETLDCCSHRLDAWITAAASRRLGDLRAGGARGASSAPTGGSRTSSCARPPQRGRSTARPCCTTARTAATCTRRDSRTPPPPASCAAAGSRIAAATRTTRRSTSTSRARECATRSRCSTACAAASRSARCSAIGSSAGCTSDRAAGSSSTASSTCCARSRRCAAASSPSPGVPVEESLAASDVVDGLRLMEVPPAAVAQKLVDGPDDKRYIVPPDAWVPPRPGEAEAVLAAIEELERHARRGRRSAARRVGAPARVRQSRARRCGARRARRRRGGAAGARRRAHAALRRADPAPHRDRRARSDAGAGRRLEHRARRARVAEPRLERWAQRALGDAGGDPRSQPVAERRWRTRACPPSTCSTTPTATVLRRARSPRGCAPRSPISATTCRRSRRCGSWRACCARCSLAGRPLDVADVGNAVEEGAVGRLADADELIARATSRDRRAQGGARVRRSARRSRRVRRAAAARPRRAALTSEEAAAAQMRLVAEATTRVENAEQPARPDSRQPTPRKSRVELASQALATVFGGGFVGRAAAVAAAGRRSRPVARRGRCGRRTRAAGCRDPAVARAHGRAARQRRRPTARRCSCAKRSAAGRCCASCSRRLAPTARWVALPFPMRSRRWSRSRAWSSSWPAPRAGDAEPDVAGAVAGSCSTSGPRSCRGGWSGATRRTRRRARARRRDDHRGRAERERARRAAAAGDPHRAERRRRRLDGDRLVQVLDEALDAGAHADVDAAADPVPRPLPAGAVLPRLVAAGRAGHRLGQGGDGVSASRTRSNSSRADRPWRSTSSTKEKFTAIESFALARAADMDAARAAGHGGRSASRDRGARARPALVARPPMAARRVRGRGCRHAAHRPRRHAHGGDRPLGAGRRRELHASRPRAAGTARAAGRARAGRGGSVRGFARARRRPRRCSRRSTMRGSARHRATFVERMPARSRSASHYPDGAHAALDPEWLRLVRLLARTRNGRRRAHLPGAAKRRADCRRGSCPPTRRSMRAAAGSLDEWRAVVSRGDCRRRRAATSSWVGERLEYHFRVGAATTCSTRRRTAAAKSTGTASTRRPRTALAGTG